MMEAAEMEKGKMKTRRDRIIKSGDSKVLRIQGQLIRFFFLLSVKRGKSKFSNLKWEHVTSPDY